MKKTNENATLQFRPRKTKVVSIEIPEDALLSLQDIATSRNMSAAALLKFYIGQGLREDVAKQYSTRMMEKTAVVLARHIRSEDKRSAILREIRMEPV